MQNKSIRSKNWLLGLDLFSTWFFKVSDSVIKQEYSDFWKLWKTDSFWAPWKSIVQLLSREALAFQTYITDLASQIRRQQK